MRRLVVGSRESKLAMIQTKFIIKELEKKNIKNDCVIRKISTKGDRILNVALNQVGGTGIFIEDLEALLRSKEIDFAVHSMKDLAPRLDDDFIIASVPKREDPRDALLSNNHIKLADLRVGAVIGTSSARRSAQIKAIRPDIETKWIRGPIDSRVEQLKNGDFDAIILAVAGLNRLNMSEDNITEYLEIDKFIPSVAQGALAIQCRKDDIEMIEILRLLNDEDTEKSVLAERYMVSLLDEDDVSPIGVYVDYSDELYKMYVSVASINGDKVIFEKAKGSQFKKVAH